MKKLEKLQAQLSKIQSEIDKIKSNDCCCVDPEKIDYERIVRKYLPKLRQESCAIYVDHRLAKKHDQGYDHNRTLGFHGHESGDELWKKAYELCMQWKTNILEHGEIWDKKYAKDNSWSSLKPYLVHFLTHKSTPEIPVYSNCCCCCNN